MYMENKMSVKKIKAAEAALQSVYDALTLTATALNVNIKTLFSDLQSGVETEHAMEVFDTLETAVDFGEDITTSVIASQYDYVIPTILKFAIKPI